MHMREREILLVEDNPADANLVREAMGRIEHPAHLTCSGDGESAAAYLHSQSDASARPDLIILDLNLPKKDGRSLLAEVKSDPKLRTIPVVVFTTSQREQDISRSYELGANCYVNKPIELAHFFATVQGIVDFWYGRASLPPEALLKKENDDRTDPRIAY